MKESVFKNIGTELLDKNGKEIREGDIVRTFFNGEFLEDQVIYKYGSFRFKKSNLHVGYQTDGEMAGLGKHTEIISNIYE